MAAKVIVLSLLCFAVVQSQVDLTLVPNAGGPDVVKAVVSKIETAGLFPTDHQMLRRIAYVESLDGEDTRAFRDGYHGGIWQVNRAAFIDTQNISAHPGLDSLYDKIEAYFGINWRFVTWEDLRMPLYSGLAARIYLSLNPDDIPLASETNEQATYWRTIYNGTAKDFATLVKALDNCNIDMDLIFVLDSSNSIGSGNYQRVREFVKNFIMSGLTIGKNDDQVGVIIFSDGAQVVLYLNTYQNQVQLLNAIDKIPYLDSYTNTAAALRQLIDEGFTEGGGARLELKTVLRVAIVMTDGMSNINPSDTPIAAARVHDFKPAILVYAVGVTDNVIQKELNEIATSPDFVENLESFDDSLLKEYQEERSYEICVRASSPVDVGEALNGTLEQGEQARFQFDIPVTGIAIRLCVKAGRVILYASTKIPNPNSAYHDWKLDCLICCDFFVDPQDLDIVQTPVRVDDTEQQPQVDESSNFTNRTLFLVTEGKKENTAFVIDTTCKYGDTKVVRILLLMFLLHYLLLMFILSLMLGAKLVGRKWKEKSKQKKEFLPEATVSNSGIPKNDEISPANVGSTNSENQVLYAACVPTHPIRDVIVVPDVVLRDESGLMVEAQKVMLKFGELVTNVKLALKSRGVTVEVFASHLMTIKGLEPVYDQSQTPLLEACIEKVRIQQSVCDAVDAISDFFSWFNHILIVNIIETFCKHNKDIKERQRDFRQHFQQYCNHRICKFARNGFGFPRKEDAAVLIVEVDTKWDTARVDQIAFIRDTISNILHVKRQALYLRTVDNVRRRLEFLVPQYIANAIVPLAVNPREQAAALSRAGVQEIHCCNVHCYFYPTTGIPTSTQTMTSKAIEEERLIHTTWYSRNTSSDLSEGRREKTTSLDKIQELRGNIRVFCRCRYDSSGPCALLFDGEGKLSCVTDQGRRKVFEFEKVYTPDTTQGEVFEDTKPIITSCVDGYSICIIAYGQTGAGKTYTMMGPIKKPGVNIRSMKELFKICSERTMVKYTMKVSIVEVYNESVYDLLIPPSEGHAKLQLHKRGKEVIVPGLTEEEVASIDDVITVMREGENNRTVASTKMNTNSSRSHLLFLLKVEGYDTVSGATSHGRLTLVDLAGSERISRSEATGTRLAEAAAINKSLSALGQVFVAIHNGAHHIPYRNSKLTHLLQPCLGGESKACTCMFVNISPLEANIPETVSTLEFGQNARQVELGKATKHVTKPTNVLSQYQ